MTEKLKVSREVADAIDSFRSEFGDETLLCRHAQGWEDHEPLCKLPMVDLATALIVGYEVRMTPHEVIANEHRRTVKEAIDGRAGRFELTELGIEKRKSFVEGIEFILDTLNIKIKGVNDR